MVGLCPEHFPFISWCQDTQRETSIVNQNLLGLTDLYYVRKIMNKSAQSRGICLKMIFIQENAPSPRKEM